MPFFPLPRRSRTFMGPHSTCLECASTYTKRIHQTKSDTSFEVYMYCSLVYALLRFMLYFGASIFTMLALIVTALTFFTQYIFIHIFFRFQYKLTVLLIMMRRHRINWHKTNDFLVYCIHINMLLVGGFGWCSMLFIEM